VVSSRHGRIRSSKPIRRVSVAGRMAHTHRDGRIELNDALPFRS
jgi:hypothetical protein